MKIQLGSGMIGMDFLQHATIALFKALKLLVFARFRRMETENRLTELRLVALTDF